MSTDAFDILRKKRDELLSASDWTQLTDVLDTPNMRFNKTAWIIYRQQLRDLPENTTDPENPVWPTPPE